MLAPQPALAGMLHAPCGALPSRLVASAPRRTPCGRSSHLHLRAEQALPREGAPTAPNAEPKGLAGWFSGMREGTRSNFALVGRASCGALVAVMPGVPEPMRRGAGADARRNGAALLCGVAYGGEAEKMDADLRFWRDGFALLIRDTLRHAPTLLSSAPLTPRQQAARERFQNDVRAFVPFSLLLVNTFPLTMPLLEPVLKKGWLPRHWLLPSAFEQERLRTVERARRLAAAADAGARRD